MNTNFLGEAKAKAYYMIFNVVCLHLKYKANKDVLYIVEDIINNEFCCI